MLQKATSIIDEEGNIASTDERKSLLIGFADMRGSMAMAIGAIRAYLLTADAAFKNRVCELWALQSEEVRCVVETPIGDDERSAEGLRLTRCSPCQILASAAENVRYPGLGPLEHGAMVPHQ